MNSHNAGHGVGRPWGLGRVARYRSTIPVEAAEISLDPVTQTALRIGPDGQVLAAPGHGTNTGTEMATSFATGDGSGPGSIDSDHSQDNDND